MTFDNARNTALLTVHKIKLITNVQIDFLDKGKISAEADTVFQRG